ncbi:MAG: DUF2029 domain-containing protein [Hyphomicrobiales bacterium]|nr:MAG: DUF2029 domain-containing protein [Hyphomicrobiales bacterium]
MNGHSIAAKSDVPLPLVQIAALGGLLVVIDAAGPALHHTYGSAAFVALMAVHAACAAWVTRLALYHESIAALAIVLCVALMTRGLLLATPPYLSTDVWRYVWDGRVQGAGINPYLYVPAAPELAHLRDTAIFPNINRADYAPTIYPPSAQWIFYLVTRFADGMRAMKVAMVAFDVATIAALVAILHRLGRPLLLVAAYAWHPLPIWEIAGNGHVDAAMLAFLMWSLWLALAGRTQVAGALATLAALVKPTALLALPVYWRPWDWRLVLIVGGLATLMYVPFLPAGWGVLGFGPGYLREEGLLSGTGLWLPQLFAPAQPLPTWLVVALYGAGALLLAGIALQAGFRRDRSPEASIGSMLLLVLVFLDILAPNYPWYFLVLVAFLPLSPAVSPWILPTFAFAFYDVIGPADPTWISLRITKVTLYLLTTIAIVLDIRSGRLPGLTGRGAKSP